MTHRAIHFKLAVVNIRGTYNSFISFVSKIILHFESNSYVDPVCKTFDSWAKMGRADLMEKEHSYAVLKLLSTLSFDHYFTFLDVGCGNGWVVRTIAKNRYCKKAIGIDKSKKMIETALQKRQTSKEQYLNVTLESWRYRGKFDYVFSMESLYYSPSLDVALKKIFSLLKEGGKFLCGTDFYADNKATAHWPKMMNLPMHLLSKAQWKKLFKENGFEVHLKQIRDPSNKRKWKREFGTLFIIGTK